jgi:hypothetical protein
MADISRDKAGEVGERMGRRAAEEAVGTVKQNVLGKDKTA